MARTLSQDLRDRVVAAIDGGMSCRAAAAHFDVSISSAIRWRRLALQHGRAVAKPRGGDRHSGRIEAHGDFIKGLLAEQGDITLTEIQARLSERGVPVGIGTVHRFFARHGITRKNVWPAPLASRILRSSDQSASTYTVSWASPWPRWISARLEPQ